MKTVDELLDAVKARHKIGSDYKLAQFLGMTDSAIRNYRHKRSLPDEVACVKIAQALEIDGDVLAAQIQSQRARDDETKAFWQRLAVRLQSGAVHASVLVGVAMVSIAGYAPNAEATALSPAEKQSCSLYIMLSIKLT
jgi:transcriptional regulator with XRE-family HTH domain